MAKRTEERLRNIFQKYVPKTVIDQYIESPESMLTPGKEAPLALIFSDIRGFTSISERMLPSEVVEMLNSYYEKMVQIIYSRGGFVDKYMGDGLLAYFGAPVHYPDDALKAVLSAFDMLDSLAGFNEGQAKLQRLPFRIGIGINYGLVTVGNIGTDHKMDYTMIGDGVNLVSRIEGLTKKYQESLLVSESVVRYLEGKHPCRLVDRVVVKGKTSGLGIYAPRRQLTATEQEAWALFAEAQKLYYGREFAAASEGFRKVQALLPQDKVAVMYLERCRQLQAAPPPTGWTGVEVMTEK
jgi:class 3 adenylate cyclase